MRVLFISEQFPYPLHDGGNLRTYHILSGLATEHDVTLLTHAATIAVHSEALSQLCKIMAVPNKPKLARLGSNLLRLGFGEPLFLLRNRSQELFNCAERLLKSEAFDIIHFNHLDTACFALERPWRLPMVFDSHNCLSDLATNAQNTVRGRLQRAVLKRERGLLGRVESATCARVNATLVCSEQERCSFERLWPSGRYEVIPNGVDTNYFNPGEREEEQSGVLLFSGAMSYWPNEQAALYFCQEVMPILGSHGRKVKVCFVGKAPTPRVRALHDGDTVIVTGEVSDVRPYIRQSQVVVVPLHHGAGTRLKILEAFAMGKAVVSTSLGVAGIPAVNEQEILIADDPRNFATQIARALDEPSLRRRLGESALKFARDRFEWKSIQRRLLNAYSRIPQGNPTRPLCLAE